MAASVVREEHGDGRRDRGNERIEMIKDRQAELRAQPLPSIRSGERSPQDHSLPRTSTKTGLASLRNLFLHIHFHIPQAATCVALGCTPFYYYVRSSANVADLPSRFAVAELTGVLARLGLGAELR